MLVKTGNASVGSVPNSYLTMSADSAHKIAAMLIEKYKSRVTPIREIVINALETTDNVVANGGEFKPVEINFSLDSIGTEVSPFAEINDTKELSVGGIITVIDHGEGMSKEFVDNVFLHLGDSSKDTDADAIGGFGIGSKSLMSITDYATWRTVKDGEATMITMSRDSVGFPVNTVTSTTEDSNGTTVTIPVDKDVMSQIINNIGKEFLDYMPSDRVIVTGDVDIIVGKVVDNISWTSSDGKVSFLPLSHRSENDDMGIHIMVNGAPYPMPHVFEKNKSDTYRKWQNGKTEEENFVDDIIHDALFDGHAPTVNERDVMYRVGDIVINLDQNDKNVMILGSREALVENDGLAKSIKETIAQGIRESVDTYVKPMTAATTVAEWMDNVERFIQAEIIDAFWGRYYYSVTISNIFSDLFGKNSTRSHRYNMNTLKVFSVDDDKEVSLAQADFTKGTVLRGEADVKLRSENKLNNKKGWKKVLNYMIRVSAAEGTSNNLILAQSIDNVLEEKDNVRFLLSSDIQINNLDLVKLFVATKFLNKGLSIDDFYDYFGVNFLSKDIEEVRKDALRIARVNNKANKSAGSQAGAITKSIITHLYVPGEGFVKKEFSTIPKFQEELKRIDEAYTNIAWLKFNSSEEKNTHPIRDMFLSKSVEQMDDIVEASFFNTVFIVETVRNTTYDSYHTRVGNIIRYDNNKNFIAMEGNRIPHIYYDMANRNGLDIYYSHGSMVLESVLNLYLSEENVAYRKEMLALCSESGLSMDDILMMTANLRKFSRWVDGEGNRILDIIMEHYGVKQGVEALLPSADSYGDPVLVNYKIMYAHNINDAVREVLVDGQKLEDAMHLLDSMRNKWRGDSLHSLDFKEFFAKSDALMEVF